MVCLRLARCTAPGRFPNPWANHGTLLAHKMCYILNPSFDWTLALTLPLVSQSLPLAALVSQLPTVQVQCPKRVSTAFNPTPQFPSVLFIPATFRFRQPRS